MRIRRVFVRSDSGPPAPVLTCIADVQIPECDVVPALAALSDRFPSLRRYRGGANSPARARHHLVSALGAVAQDAKRSTDTVGVDVLEARGTAAHLADVYAALAPHVRDGSYVQVNDGGAKSYWTFEAGRMVANTGEHPEIQSLATSLHSRQTEFGAA